MSAITCGFFDQVKLDWIARQKILGKLNFATIEEMERGFVRRLDSMAQEEVKVVAFSSEFKSVLTLDCFTPPWKTRKNQRYQIQWRSRKNPAKLNKYLAVKCAESFCSFQLNFTYSFINGEPCNIRCTFSPKKSHSFPLH